jgi:hypothetical protein
LFFFTLSFFTEYSISRISFGGREVRGLHRHIIPDYFGLSLIEEKCQLESGSSAIGWTFTHPYCMGNLWGAILSAPEASSELQQYLFFVLAVWLLLPISTATTLGTEFQGF